MKKIVTIIGSPRGQASNSTVIAHWFNPKHNNILYLNKINKHESYMKQVFDSDYISFVFPLYVDGMPAQVKAFFELMETNKTRLKGKKIVYIIHSGFPDGIHLENLKKYLILFSNLLGLDHRGVITIPGSEGFRLMPQRLTQKKASILEGLGRSFIKGQVLKEKDLNELQGPLRFSKSKIILYRLMSALGLTNMYWNSNLKKNKAFKNRFTTPYKNEVNL